VFSLALGRTSWLPDVPGTKVGNAREGSWSQRCEALALLGR
jgi:hypothetical protein